MRGQIIFVSLAFLLVIASTSAESHSPNPCEHFDGTPKMLHRCDKKEVSITAQVSDFVMQHPTGIHDRLNLKTKSLDRRHETYVDFGDPPSQIVLTSNEPIKCENSIQITGTVDLVALGGKKGTKGEYANPWIKVKKYRCLNKGQAE